MIDKLLELAELKEIKSNTADDKRKYRLIKDILNEKNCFFKLDMETAYAILRDLDIEENSLQEVYMSLITIK